MNNTNLILLRSRSYVVMAPNCQMTIPFGDSSLNVRSMVLFGHQTRRSSKSGFRVKRSSRMNILCRRPTAYNLYSKARRVTENTSSESMLAVGQSQNEKLVPFTRSSQEHFEIGSDRKISKSNCVKEKPISMLKIPTNCGFTKYGLKMIRSSLI